MASAGPPQQRRPKLIDINLVPRREVRPPISLFGVIVALLIMAFAYAIFPIADIPNLYGLWHEQREDVDELEDTLAEKEAEYAYLLTLSVEAQALQTQINELESLLGAMSGDYQVLSQSAVTWSEVLEMIHEVAPAGVNITSITEGSKIEIEGTAATGDDVTSFAMALSNTGLFGTVGPTEMEYEPAEDGGATSEIVLDDCEDAWVGLPAAETEVDNCDDEWVGRWALVIPVDNCDLAWTSADAAVTCSPDAGEKKEGAASTRQVIALGFTTGLIAYSDFAPAGEDLSGVTHIEFWVRSNVNRNAGDLKLLLDDALGCGTPLETLTIPALTANTWTKVSVVLASLPADRTAIVSVGLYASVDPGVCTIWIDDVKAVIPEVTCSFDTTDKMAGSASAKQVLDDAFPAPGLIAHKNFAAKDLSTHKQVTFWIKSSEARNAGDLQLLLDNTPDCPSPLEALDLPALTEDVWTSVTLNLLNPSALTAIVSVGLKATVDPGVCTIWLDDIKAVLPGVTCTADILEGNFKEGEASAKMEIGGPFGTGVIAYEDLTAPKDLTNYEAITFWIKSSVDRIFGDLQFLLDDNSGCETPWETINIPPLAKDVWTRVSLSFSDPEKLIAIVSMGLEATVDPGASTIWVDEVKVSTLTATGDYIFTITVSLTGGSQ